LRARGLQTRRSNSGGQSVTEPEGFSLRERARSFGPAGRGIGILLREQHNARIHLAVTAAVCAAGLFFGISRFEWCALLLAMGLVWGAEAVNSAVEYLADAAVPEQHPLIGKSKDVAAGATLLCAIAAAAVGGIVFAPHVAAWVGV
jgi:diacylglycerol kinase (ATP)